MKKSFMLAAIAMCSIPLAHAESPWLIKAGISDVIPTSNGGNLAGMQAAGSKDLQFTPSVEYQLDPHLAAELLLATPFQHDVSLNGTIVAKTKELPPTLTLKYRFAPIRQIQPYFGLGVNETFFWGEKTTGPLSGSRISAGNSFGMAGLIGAEYRLPESPWGVAVDIRYIDIKSQITLNGNKLGTLTVDPWVFGAGLTYRFQ